MREILFRGKRIGNGEWATGFIYEHQPPLQCIVPENYIPEKSKWYICNTAFADWNMPRQVEFVEVDPSTVGQFTGLTDKNGKKVFDGDIVRCLYGETFYQNEIIFVEGGFCVRHNHNEYACCAALSEHESIEIIGNIHDNPEL